MVDSDDNNNNSNIHTIAAGAVRKRRDRGFRCDREDIGGGGAGGNNLRGNRDSWRSRKSHHGHGPSMYARGYNKSPCRYRDHSPSIPYAKRIRRDWDSQENNVFNYPLPNQVYPDLQSIQAVYPIKDESPSGYAQMLSFKAFLNDQEDNIDESDAAVRYTEYKNEFRRNQISDFFLTHKEEEWFRSKYDPELKKIRLSKERENILNRLEMCMELYEEGYLDDIRLDLDQTEKLVQLLDTAVMRCESKELANLSKIKKITNPESAKTVSVVESKDENSQSLQSDGDDVTITIINKDNVDRNDNYLNNNDVVSEDNNDASMNDCDNVINATADPLTDSTANKTQKNDNVEVVKHKAESGTPDDDLSAKTCSIFLRSLPSSVTREEIENMCQKYAGFKRAALADPLPERRFQRRGWLTFEPWVDVKKICWEINSQKLWSCDVGAIVNRELIRRIRPVDSITNYVTVMLNDLKMIISIVNCMDSRWSLWNSTISDAQNDSNIDAATKSNDASCTNKEAAASNINKNPLVNNADTVLKFFIEKEEKMIVNATADTVNIKVADEQLKKTVDQLILYLRFVHSIDFYNAVEYQLEDHMPNRCGILHVRSAFGIEDNVNITKDKNFSQLASKSANSIENYKDLLRAVDSKAVDTTKISESENTQLRLAETIKHWIEKFTERLEPFTHNEPTSIDIEHAVGLGLKDEEGEVEKFITQNTVKVCENKWSCPLSGKKFRGPEFVRKHIFNKHQEKIDNVRREVQCFNNFVMDAKRPHLPEQIITRPIIFNSCVPYKSSGYHYSSQSGGHKFTHYMPNMWNTGAGHGYHGSKTRGRGGSTQGLNNENRHNKQNINPINRERETVKYDINYSDLEDPHFQA